MFSEQVKNTASSYTILFGVLCFFGVIAYTASLILGGLVSLLRLFI